MHFTSYLFWQELTRLLAITKNDTEIDHEDEQRELYILTLQSYMRDAMDELDMLEEVSDAFATAYCTFRLI